MLILALVKATNLNIDYILELRKRHGWGWGEMAHRLGVHPGTFNRARARLKKQDYSVGEDLLLIILAGYWGLPLGHVRALRAPPDAVRVSDHKRRREGRHPLSTHTLERALSVCQPLR